LVGCIGELTLQEEARGFASNSRLATVAAQKTVPGSGGGPPMRSDNERSALASADDLHPFRQSRLLSTADQPHVLFLEITLRIPEPRQTISASSVSSPRICSFSIKSCRLTIVAQASLMPQWQLNMFQFEVLNEKQPSVARRIMS
jgi:hypothetical protein